MRRASGSDDSGKGSVRPGSLKGLGEVLRELGAEDVRVVHAGAVLVTVGKGRLRGFVEGLLKSFEGEARYSTGVGTDFRPLEGSYAMTHVIALDRVGAYVLVEVRSGAVRPSIPSITPVMPAANWAEREARDMLGIEFDGHPEPVRLILPDDWPEGVYPLRKDFPYDLKLSGVEGVDVGRMVGEPRNFSVSPRVRSPDAEVAYASIPVGPYHPALHEPEYYELYVEGERVVDAKYRGFFVHRGMEKLAESRMTVNQVPFLAERICGICGYTHACAYCQAVEAAAGIEVPERALFIRSILLEIERLHSHLLWFGVAFHLLGFDTGFMAMWRIREDVMRVAEALTGNRKTYGMNLVGGVRRDVRGEKVSLVTRMLGKVEEEFKGFCRNALRLSEVVERVKEVGILTREDAMKLGAVGPHARASGLEIDVRADHPYAAYGFIDVNVAVKDSCDVLARILVRYEEVLESVRLIREFLKLMPEGELMAEYGEIPPLRVGVGVTEAPRGEDVHYVVTGLGNRVYRWRPRAPSYMNLATVPTMLRGERLANVPIIIASIDPCFSCTDHAVVVDVRTGARRVIKLQNLLRGCPP